MNETLESRVNRALQKFQNHPVELQVDVAVVFAVISQVQLALRHPANRGATAAIARTFVKGLAVVLTALDESFGEAIEAGLDPTKDVPFAAPPKGGLS